MKNLIKFSFLFLTILCFASCTKEYTCVCTAAGVTATSTIIEASSKSKAREECDMGDLSIFGVVIDCEIE